MSSGIPIIWTPHMDDQLAAIRDEGASLPKAAQRLGISEDAVRERARKRWGKWSRPKEDKPDEVPNQ